MQSDYPSAPEKRAIPYDMLPNYCQKIADHYETKVYGVKKFITNLGEKTNYAVHYRNLQLHLSLGMKLTKIHKILKFKQSDWMKTYIHFNTKKRTKASKSFEKDFFEMMINSDYGKTMENFRKRISVRIVNNEKDYLKHISKPTYIAEKFFGKKCASALEIKPVLTLNKAIYVGLTALEWSKRLVYDFHYNFIKKN